MNIQDKLPAASWLNTKINRELAAPVLSQEEQVERHKNKVLRMAELKHSMGWGTIAQKTEGVAIEMSQDPNFKHVQIMDEKHFTASIGIWSPLICNTQSEADYLGAVGLMLGYDTHNKIFVRCQEADIGKHYGIGIDTQPTYVRIPMLDLIIQ